MTPRIDYYREAPRGLAALRQLEDYLHDSGLPAPLLHLIKTRASQINGCAYCLIAEHPHTDARIEELRRQFSDKEIADLTLAIVAINGWNRLAITFHTPVGSYQPRIKAQAESS